MKTISNQKMLPARMEQITSAIRCQVCQCTLIRGMLKMVDECKRAVPCSTVVDIDLSRALG